MKAEGEGMEEEGKEEEGKEEAYLKGDHIRQEE